MRIRDKNITAACRTEDGLEWTSLRIKAEGNEVLQQDRMLMELPEDLSRLELPEQVLEQISGEVTVALRASELLMRTMVLPTSDPEEISEMIMFQVDKFSPFPIDQLCAAHEILEIQEDSALVLMAAAKRGVIDAIGDVFEQKGIRIHRIDARVLGWLRLMHEAETIAAGCEIIVIADGIDFVLVVTNNGKPMTIRPLHAQIDDMQVVDELTQEIDYTLTTLETEYAELQPSSIQFCCFGEKPTALTAKLAIKTKLNVEHLNLGTLPPLSEGMLQRTLSKEQHIEMIPQEWVEHQKRVLLRKRFTLISASIAAVWVIVLLGFFSVFMAREMALDSMREEANEIAPAARQAATNQKKLKTLKLYADRTDSSIECLREVTRMLPAGDIEFTSFKYNKGKGVALQGTARDSVIVTDYFATLSESPLFEGTKNVSVREKATKGVKRTIYSVFLPFESAEVKK